jgi:hypothetical protein
VVVAMRPKHSAKEPDTRRLDQARPLGQHCLRLIPPPPTVVQNAYRAPAYKMREIIFEMHREAFFNDHVTYRWVHAGAQLRSLYRQVEADPQMRHHTCRSRSRARPYRQPAEYAIWISLITGTGFRLHVIPPESRFLPRIGRQLFDPSTVHSLMQFHPPQQSFELHRGNLRMLLKATAKTSLPRSHPNRIASCHNGTTIAKQTCNRGCIQRPMPALYSSHRIERI